MFFACQPDSRRNAELAKDAVEQSSGQFAEDQAESKAADNDADQCGKEQRAAEKVFRRHFFGIEENCEEQRYGDQHRAGDQRINCAVANGFFELVKVKYSVNFF